MSSSQHDQNHNNLAARVHAATKTVHLVRQTDTYPNRRVSAYNLEKNGEDTVRAQILDRIVRLN
jgi:hypothetical protein